MEEAWTPAEWDVHDVGSGTDPMELAAAVFEWGYQRKDTMTVGDLRQRFPIPASTFYDLLGKARDEGLVRIVKRFGQSDLVYPLRMV